ncbi:MAG: alkaline phosphatase family protein [Candidatus Aminicenantes bacterium]|nr:alkaline phosphatase family protein [Candidatus Aminicenantes bacterium]
MKRREFIKNTGLLLTFPALFSRSGAVVKSEKALILGFDGMDPGIVRSMIKRGELPNIRKFMQGGTFTDMLSTAPPESPCAWASFATGKDPAGHGIFGFLSRHPENYIPFSTSEPIKEKNAKTVEIGGYKLPYSSAESRLNREGTPFWDYIMDRKIDSTVFKMPSNYPPSKMKYGRAIAGMGTPDITGTQGVYTLYTSDENEAMTEGSGKGRFNYAFFDENEVMEGEIQGPKNDLRTEPEPVFVPFRVYRDKKHRTVRIDIQGTQVLLQEGQLSEWVEIKFEMIPMLNSISAMVRFYLLENRGERFRLYITPGNISPADPAQVISSPESYSKELAKAAGPFHTLGLPADFNAIKKESFSMENYIVQSQSIFAESKKLFKYELERFLGMKRAMLFYYFSSIDQGSHIYWALRDPLHPNYRAAEAKKYGDRIESLYREFDKIIGEVVKELPKDVPLIILSDHGFAPLRRQIDLNALLFRGGFLKLNGKPDYDDSMALLNQGNWDKTKAYAMSLNGIYINLRGREGEGSVAPADKKRVLAGIKKMLLDYKDPETGKNPIGKVFITEEVYKGDFLDRGPDIIVGCNRGYGLDYGCAMGGIGRETVKDNMSRWTGDHIIDPHQVPALLMGNFKMDTKKKPVIWDVAPTILNIFGIPTPKDMRGKSLV